MARHRVVVVLLLAFCCSLVTGEATEREDPNWNTSSSPIEFSESGEVNSTSVTSGIPTATQTIMKITAASATGAPEMPPQNMDPMVSKICRICTCRNEIPPFQVDCSDKKVKESFLDSDWPLNSSLAFMTANFDHNQLLEIAQFPGLPISSLSFVGNSINVIQPSAFKQLLKLEHLDLSENNLTQESIQRKVFEGHYMKDEYEPITLRTLNLGYNQIHSLDKDAFDHISFLEVLELNNNPFEIIDHQTGVALTSLRKLKVLNLAETQLSTIPDGFLHGLRDLRVLILSGNKFATVPSDLQRSINLEFLNLNNNPIATLNFESFKGMRSLKQLNISSMPLLENITCSTFTPLPELTSMWCSFNPRLRAIHAGAFKGIATSPLNFKLSEFHFRGNNVSSIPSTLLPWQDLDLIDIEENPFICDCRAGWLIRDLLPIITDITPELTQSIKCAGPEQHKGHSLSSMSEDKSIVRNCTSEEERQQNKSINDWRMRPPFTTTSSYSVGLMVVSLLGIFVVIGCMAVMAVRKNHLRQMYDQSTGQFVHYFRTPAGDKREDDEQAIVSYEYTQFQNMSDI